MRTVTLASRRKHRPRPTLKVIGKMETPAYSEELKMHTAKVHVELEQKLIPLIESVNTLPQYARLLQIFFGFYAPLEYRLLRVADIEKVTDGIQLRKADSLKNDILAIESHAVDMVLCDDLPALSNVSSAWGVMYVLEGSTLGGKAIAKILRKKLGSDSAIPFSFFLHYGDETKEVWDQFNSKLDGASGLSKPDLLSSAAETFVLFKSWVDRNSVVIVQSDIP